MSTTDKSKNGKSGVTKPYERNDAQKSFNKWPKRKKKVSEMSASDYQGHKNRLFQMIRLSHKRILKKIEEE